MTDALGRLPHDQASRGNRPRDLASGRSFTVADDSRAAPFRARGRPWP
ncbi:Hypothetical protein A7982_06982 [Minicystis rosea]|nr:Hypothetical protein A7982_06982 [Minicystis rosea]